MFGAVFPGGEVTQKQSREVLAKRRPGRQGSFRPRHKGHIDMVRSAHAPSDFFGDENLRSKADVIID